MWFKINDCNFLGKKTEKDNGVFVLVSDLKETWQKFLSDDELIFMIRKFNPLFEAPIPKLKEITLSLFDENDNVKKKAFKENENLILKLQSVKMNMKIQLQITLLKSDGGMLYEEFTIPLLLTVWHLKIREKNLIQIIEEKDSEINEYKEENNGFIKCLRSTKQFVEKEFNDKQVSNHANVYLQYDFMSFINCISPKISDIVSEKETNFVSENSKAILNSANMNETDSSHAIPVKSAIILNHNLIKRRKKLNKIF